MKVTWGHYPFESQLTRFSDGDRPAAGPPVEDAEEQKEAPAPAWRSDLWIPWITTSYIEFCGNSTCIHEYDKST